MSLSHQSLEILYDILEVKIHDLQVQDRDDIKELSRLRKCRQELMTELKSSPGKTSDKLFRSGRTIPREGSTRGRQSLT